MGTNIDTHLILYEDRTMVDAATLVQLLKHELAALKARVDFNNTILNEIDQVRLVSRVKNHGTLIKRLGFKLEHEIKENGVIKVGEVLHSSEHTKNELDPLIAIALDRVLLQVRLPLGILGDDLAEALLFQASKRVVVVGNDRSATRAVINQGNLTKVVTIAKLGLLEFLAAHMVSDLDTAVSTSFNEVHSGVLTSIAIHELILFDHGLLWVSEPVTEAHQDRSEERFVAPLALVVLELVEGGKLALRQGDLLLTAINLCHRQLNDLVLLFQSLDKHFGTHTNLQTWRELFQEVVQLVGNHLCLTRALEELSDFITKWARQVNVLHGRVCVVDRLLLALRLGADLSDQHGQLTENVRLENGTRQVNHHHEDQLLELFGTHLVATDDQDGVVQADPVEEHALVVLIPVPESIRAIVVVVGGHPRLVTAIFLGLHIGLQDKEEPEAANQVKVDNEEHVIVQHHHHNLATLVEIGLRDEGGDAEDAINFHDTDHVQVPRGRRRIV